VPSRFDVPDPHQSFKGIALFTPGGDLAYCIDVFKSQRWHLQLCIALQEALSLSEPPHFLVPCYTATVDCIVDSTTQTRRFFAEACPRVLRYQVLLNAVFGTENLVWNRVNYEPEVCDPDVLQLHKRQFPTLWQEHNLVIPVVGAAAPARVTLPPEPDLDLLPTANHGCVLRLFVAGNSIATEYALESLHKFLETYLQQPYTLKVIDVQQYPEQAEYHQITATPTLMRVWPLPTKRIVGQLDDTDTLRRLLNL
jgi:circadian clock protein KaiB